MFLEHFQTTLNAVAQILILASVGFFLVRKKFLSQEGLNSLSWLVMNIALPSLIFFQLVKDFNFSIYPDWWIYPLISIGITLAAFLIAWMFSYFINGQQHKLQFLSLVSFQNSGYLPLVLVAGLLSGQKLDSIFIYIFLFLVGFNLVMFSFGVYLLSFNKNSKLELKSFFSMPVVVTLGSLMLIYFGGARIVPQTLLKPVGMLGNCTLPLAMLVVGGNLARINLSNINKKAMILMLAAKMIILPFIGLWFILYFRPPQLISMLILIELAMPSAVTLSVIVRHCEKEDLLISQGIFLSHILSIATIPLFLILYFSLVVVQ